MKKGIIIAIIVVLLAVGGYIIWDKYYKDSGDDTDNNQSSQTPSTPKTDGDKDDSQTQPADDEQPATASTGDAQLTGDTQVDVQFTGEALIEPGVDYTGDDQEVKEIINILNELTAE